MLPAKGGDPQVISRNRLTRSLQFQSDCCVVPRGLNANIEDCASVQHSLQGSFVSLAVAGLRDSKSKLPGNDYRNRNCARLGHNLNYFRCSIQVSGKGIRIQNQVQSSGSICSNSSSMTFCIRNVSPVEMCQFARTFQPGLARPSTSLGELFFDCLRHVLAQGNPQCTGGGLGLAKGKVRDFQRSLHDASIPYLWDARAPGFVRMRRKVSSPLCAPLSNSQFPTRAPGPRPSTRAPPVHRAILAFPMLRVRFAPSPTGFLHIGSARTFIFNWLYARHNGGAMILRIDDTDVERNTEVSLNSIFDGLRWLGLGWDEQYKQSERLALHRQTAEAIFQKGLAYRDFTPAHTGDAEKSGAQGTWLFNADMREMSREESDRRAAAGEPFALRFRVPRDVERHVQFTDAVYGEQSKSTADIEDFALLRSDGMPTYHLASCADDADLRISHIIRGQDHITNTFKHVLIFEAAGVTPPRFGHLPLLVAPDGTKLSKRRHGPVVSVTTYRDAGFLPEAFANFIVLLGWSPKNDREQMTRQELIDTFTLEGVNRSNAVVNFKDEDPFDPKAVWLNAEHIRTMPPEELSKRLLPVVQADGVDIDEARMARITPLIRERIKLLNDVRTVADFFFVKELAPYETTELIPSKKGDAAMALRSLEEALTVLAAADFTHDGLEAALRAAAGSIGVKAGQMFEPIRVAVCGRKTAPPLFGTLEVLGREVCLARIEQAIGKLKTL